MAKENPNLALFNRVRSVPPEALKLIQAGRLKGKSDINPMFRIKTLTTEFGPVGVGWYYETVTWTEDVAGERILYMKMKLYVKFGGEWSKPIEGYGGAMISTKEKGGMFNDDDAAKKALTDCLSQACRSLGIGADVYWELDATKYHTEQQIEKSKWDTIAYLPNVKTVKDLQDFWNTYSPYYGNDKDFRTAYVKRQKELQDGTHAQ